jgi:hypothetical protein
VLVRGSGRRASSFERRRFVGALRLFLGKNARAERNGARVGAFGLPLGLFG